MACANLFMAVGYLLGGGTGAVIALFFAGVTNLFSYWHSDKLMLVLAPIAAMIVQMAHMRAPFTYFCCWLLA